LDRAILENAAPQVSVALAARWALMKASAAWGWADFRAHWLKTGPDDGPLWPLWLALAVLAFALLNSFSLTFDAAWAGFAPGIDPPIRAVFERITHAGESNWFFALSILAFLYAQHRRAFATTARVRAQWGLLASRALYVFAVLAVSGLLSQAIKHLVGRARPKLIETLGPHHFDLFSLKAVLASFPSGHTTTVFAAAAALSFFRPRWAPLFFALALPVAASRLILDAHYPSDVLGGAFLGLASAFAVARVFGRRKIAFTLDEGRLMPRARRLSDQA
jgi:membrane-associated phospholipid phosphatase